MGRLQKFLKLTLVEERIAQRKAKVADVQFSHLLSEHMAQPEDTPREKHSGSFYPSMLYHGCKRAMAYGYLAAPSNPHRLDPKLRMIFLFGNGVHNELQATVTAMAQEHKAEVEHEYRVSRDTNPWFIQGRIDSVWQSPDEPFKRGVEYKTINKDGFNRLYREPKTEHLAQGNTYQGLVKRMPVMHYIYFCKDNSQIKEFAVRFNEDLFAETVGEIEEILLLLKSGRLPNRIRPDCKDPACRYRDVCWESRYTVDRLVDERSEKELTDFTPVYRSAR